MNIFFHLEYSPIKTPEDGPARGSRTLHAALDLFEKHDIRAELAMTGIFAQQMMEDYPADIERIKRMKFPITRYPGVGHAEPNPVGRGHIELRNLRRSAGITSFSDEIVAAWWDHETKTLVPGWHIEDGRLVLGNSEENRPIRRQELGNYHLPDKAEYLFGGRWRFPRLARCDSIPSSKTTFGITTPLWYTIGFLVKWANLAKYSTNNHLEQKWHYHNPRRLPEGGNRNSLGAF